MEIEEKSRTREKKKTTWLTKTITKIDNPLFVCKGELGPLRTELMVLTDKRNFFNWLVIFSEKRNKKKEKDKFKRENTHRHTHTTI